MTPNMETETTMSLAFKDVGVSRSTMRAFALAKDFIAEGGTPDEWVAIYWNAKDKTFQTGRDQVSTENHSGSVPPRPVSEVVDHSSSANRSTPVHASRPSPTPDQKAAVRDAVAASARTAFDTIKTRDGVLWGDIPYYELAGRADDGKIAQRIRDAIGAVSPKQEKQAVRDLLRVDVFVGLLKMRD